MSTPFAAIEAATATAAVAALANATADINGSSAIGIFDNGHAGSFGGLVDDTGPVFTAETDDLTEAEVNSTIGIGALGFVVTAVEDDGTGVTVLRLKPRAANAFSTAFSSAFGYA